MRTELFTKEPDISKVRVTDNFWKQRMELVRTKVLPYEWDALNDRIEGAASSHAVANFKLAAKLTKEHRVGTIKAGSVRTEQGQAVSSGEENGFEGFVFQDSDIAKWLETVAYTLMWEKDAELEKTADDVIDLVCAAQQEDGYLDTFYIINGLDKRFTNLQDNHELYCLGHLLEAAVAYTDATGKDKLLKALIRYVDYVDGIFGPEPGKKKGYPGHEEIELALVKLFRITGNKKYLKLAKFFIDQRGAEPNYFVEECLARNDGKPYTDDLSYYQAHKPVRKQEVAVGHAVRAAYLYTGMADVARLTKDDSLLETCERLWEDVTKKQMYITGSIGSSPVGEAFTFDYDLPGDSIYGETCAAIGLAFFAKRMLMIQPKGEYGDVLEKLLYNGIISGISLDGTRFFYVNPLEVYPKKNHMDARFRHVKTERQKWFGCACCPPNIARITASLASFLSSYNDDSFYTHIPAGAQTEAMIAGNKVIVTVEGNYPWDGNITVKIDTERPFEFTYGIRIPSWCDSFTAELNGVKIEPAVSDGYLKIKRVFKAGDELKLSLPMEVKIMEADCRVRSCFGRVSIMRGPVVYCLEEIDNGPDLHRIRISENAEFTAKEERELNGVTALYCMGFKELPGEGELYRPVRSRRFETIKLKFIPYYAWANRGEGEMTVWINRY